jgi:methionyl-tRNA formyltransferase
VRLAFFGSTRFSCLVLSRLVQSRHGVVAVITQPDQPAGRRLELAPTELCGVAEATALPVLKPERLRNNHELRAQLRALKLDALLVAAYGQIIPPKLLDSTPWPLNVHPSALPKLRGASPIRSALLQSLAGTACCVMRMTPAVDDGDVLCREALAIPPDWNYGQLEEALGRLGGELACSALDALERGTVKLTPQNNAEATYCPRLTRDETIIDWTRPAAELYDFVRAWDPDVGACTHLPDGRRLKVWRAALSPEPGLPAPAAAPGQPGEVAMVGKRHCAIATGDGLLWLAEVQPENRPRMSVASFLAGHPLTAGVRLA